MAKPASTPAPLKGRKARKAARAGQPKRSKQILEAFTLTRRRDKRLVPYIVLAFVVTVGVFFGIGQLLGSPIVFTAFGVVSGSLVAFIVFVQRAQGSALGEIEGQPG